MGRFLTPDPFGRSPSPERPNSWNRYAYVENDPVNYTDPSGLFISGYPSVSTNGSPASPWSAEFRYTGGAWDYWLLALIASANPVASAARPAPRLNRDRLVEGAANLINEEECSNFLVNVGRRAFMTIAGKSNPDELSPGERSYYDAITAANIIGRLQGATFTDANRRETDQWGNSVSARANYGRDGADQSVTVFDDFFDEGTRGRNQIVVHEGMHLIFAFGDADLARATGVYTEDRNASSNFHRELQNHCR
jgi:hypothetical protein